MSEHQRLVITREKEPIRADKSSDNAIRPGCRAHFVAKIGSENPFKNFNGLPDVGNACGARAIVSRRLLHGVGKKFQPRTTRATGRIIFLRVAARDILLFWSRRKKAARAEPIPRSRRHAHMHSTMNFSVDAEGRKMPSVKLG
jgi:hypothetical protein